MKWKKTLIKVNELDSFQQNIQRQIKDANPIIETSRCIFKYKDNIITYMYTIFDFIDNYENLIKQDTIDKFYLYQPFD